MGGRREFWEKNIGVGQLLYFFPPNSLLPPHRLPFIRLLRRLYKMYFVELEPVCIELLIVGMFCSKYKNLPVLVGGTGVRGSISASKQVRGAKIL